MKTKTAGRTRPKNWKREYPWTPTDEEKTVAQSFAAIRSGVLPAITINDKGYARYTLLDVRTKAGLADYIENDKRTLGISHQPRARAEVATTTARPKPTKKKRRV